jgi:hypothetical protein
VRELVRSAEPPAVPQLSAPQFDFGVYDALLAKVSFPHT